MKNTRPKHLALHLIKLPLPAFVSILHRISGLLLFLALPLLLWMLQYSLTSVDTFARLQECLASPLMKLVLLLLMWAGLHHLCAGIRFLMIDAHWIRKLPQARFSSKLVLVISLALTVVCGVMLW